MHITVILGHPYGGSLNTAIAEAVRDRLLQNGHTVGYHDLQAEGFDPAMPPGELVGDTSEDPLVRAHQEEIRRAQGIVVVHPNWWGQPPAVLKGWVDRVLRENIAYRFPEGDSGGGLPVGLLQAKAGIVFNTSNTAAHREDAVFGDPLERIWRDCIFAFCGVHTFERRMFRIVADSTPTQRAAWLEEAAAVIDRRFPPAR